MSTIPHDIYEQDFYAWAKENVELIRQGRVNEVDYERIAEELEELTGNTRRELYRRLRVLLAPSIEVGMAGCYTLQQLGGNYPHPAFRRSS